MSNLRAKFALMVGGVVILGASGGCLPANFFADLAGSALSSTVSTLLNALLSAAVGAGAGA